MKSSNGWVKIHRQFLEWEWYDDANTKIMFLHLLLKANHKDKKYRGQLVKRGSLLTGRELLSKETGLSEMQVRTSLNKLKSTNEITIKSSNKGTEIQIVKYNDYQVVTNEVTNEQPASNQQVTTNKNVKKEKKYNIREHLSSLGCESKLISEWLEVRAKKKAANTETAIERWVSKVDKSSMSHNEALKICVERSWVGFDVSWLPKQTHIHKPQNLKDLYE